MRLLLLEDPLRQGVAVTLDLALIYCRHEYVYGENDRTVKLMLRVCKRRLGVDAVGEEARLRDGLEKLLEHLGDYPEEAFDALVALRSSFVVPVPGIVAERLGEGRGLVLLSPNAPL